MSREKDFIKELQPEKTPEKLLREDYERILGRLNGLSEEELIEEMEKIPLRERDNLCMKAFMYGYNELEARLRSVDIKIEEKQIEELKTAVAEGRGEEMVSRT